MTATPLLRYAAGVALTVPALALAGCNVEAENTGASTATTVGEIHQDIETYLGEDLTVQAEVEEILSPFAFTIIGTEDTSEPILVVAADEWSDLEPTIPVQVEGQVRGALVLVDLEEELGMDLDEATYAEWEGLTYIVSEHAERIDP